MGGGEEQTDLHLIDASLSILLPALLPLLGAGHVPDGLFDVAFCVGGVAAEHGGVGGVVRHCFFFLFLVVSSLGEQ